MDLNLLSDFLLALIALLLVLVLPGAVWLLWARPARCDALEWLAEAVASSLSLTALAGMLLAFLGLSLNGFGAGALFAGLVLVWVTVKIWQGLRFRVRGRTLVMLGALLALAAWRLFQARALVLPAWVDSVHHTLLVRIILERGILPGDWLPYLPVPMYYHFGFHVSAALFSFFSRFEPTQTLLVFGQVLNALVAVSVYRLAKVIWGSITRAVVAGLLVGFVFQMPAYYVTWGRYTMLAGLVVLPMAMAAALEVQHNPRSRYAWGRLALYSAGVCFCHFLAVGLLALFLLVMLVFEVVRAGRARQWGNLTWQPYAAWGLGMLAAAPWLGRVWFYTASSFKVAIADPFDATQVEAVSGYLNYLLYLLGPWRGHFLLILAGLGMLLAVRNCKTRLLAVWGALLVLLATPWSPQFNPFRPDHLAIVLFLPASLLAADLLASAGDALSQVWRKMAGVVGLWVAVASLLVWGVIEGRDILNPVTVFTSAADVAALEWIEQHTLPADRFYINAAPWQGSLYRGVDGGYWITPSTGRTTLLPPLAYGWGPPEDMQRITDIARHVSQVKSCSDEFWQLIRENQITHLYLKEMVGSLQPEVVNTCMGIEPVYAQNGIWIYRIGKK